MAHRETGRVEMKRKPIKDRCYDIRVDGERCGSLHIIGVEVTEEMKLLLEGRINAGRTKRKVTLAKPKGKKR